MENPTTIPRLQMGGNGDVAPTDTITMSWQRAGGGSLPVGLGGGLEAAVLLVHL